jgi:hypothetical protein
MREGLFIGGMLSVEALVVAHWFWLPGHPALAALALGAGMLMAAMALGNAALLVGVLRRDPADPQERAELRDLGEVTPLWLAVLATQVGFTAAAVAAQVYWIVAVMLVGQGGEIVAVAIARHRTRGSAPVGEVHAT